MSDFFSNDELIVSATAPGRMDVMGGIADYSGSLLLQMPIKQTTTVQVQLRHDGVFKFRTQLSKKNISDFIIDYAVIKNKPLAEAGQLIKSFAGGEWAVYVLGCFLVLQKEKNIELSGANVFIQSSVPWGKGVSSSAALEVAVMNALNRVHRLQPGREELPLLAQMAENLVAGAPCGLMDQLSTHLGEKNKLLPLICQPHQVFKAIKIPRGISFMGIDSGIRHAVSGASYSDVRAAAFMGYSIIALHEGVTEKELLQASTSGDWSHLPFKGFLANMSPADFLKKYSSVLPEEISGKEFLARYKLSIDTVTKIDEHKKYKLLACSSHPVFENERINSFSDLLKNFNKQTNAQASLIKMGKLMLQSHQSYSSIGLGNEHIDEIVSMVCAETAVNGVFGARITGGGNGGTVCILSYGKEGKETVKEIYRRYRAKRKQKLFLFSGSSHGALRLNQYF